MKDSEVYRKAAQRMEQGKCTGRGACWAIINITHPNVREFTTATHPLGKKMKALYAPESTAPFWLEDLGTDGRILALCFMAAIAESEGK